MQKIITSMKPHSFSIMPNGEVSMCYTPLTYKLNMKIGLTGPSGSGKTTLANFIISTQKNVDRFIPGSASLMHSEEAQEELKAKFNYDPLGHKAVIVKSNVDPAFGLAFQRLLLESRVNKLSLLTNIVTDRTPIDNLTYFMMQCSHNQTEQVTKEFILKSIKGLADSGLTHIVLVQPKSDWTEDNGSRVANNYYQHMTYAVFKHTIDKYFKDTMNQFGIKFLELDYWFLDDRKEAIIKFLSYE